MATAPLPPDVVAVAKSCVLDWFGCAITGAHDASVDAVAADLALSADAPCTLVGRRARAAAADAALVNGVAGDALDFSDTLRAMHGHATATVLPAALALAEGRDANGEALLRAFVAGVEIAARVGLLLGDGVLELPLHPTAGAGTLGAAAAGAFVLGLDRAGWIAALGIAATQAAGLADAVGTSCKPLHAGVAAANGVRAALLASRGFTATAAAMEPEGAFARTHSARAGAEAVEAASERYLIVETLLKAYAACALTHGPVDALLDLRVAHAIAPDDVAAIAFAIAGSSTAICDIREPHNGTEARFSLRTVAAMALLGYDLGDADAYGPAVTDPAIAALRERCDVHGDPALPVAVSRARVTLRDGRTFNAERDERAGIAPAERMQRSALKFHRLADPVLGSAGAGTLAGHITRLERLSGASKLLTAAVPA